jgi:hypothetical protein
MIHAVKYGESEEKDHCPQVSKVLIRMYFLKIKTQCEKCICCTYRQIWREGT